MGRQRAQRDPAKSEWEFSHDCGRGYLGLVLRTWEACTSGSPSNSLPEDWASGAGYTLGRCDILMDDNCATPWPLVLSWEGREHTLSFLACLNSWQDLIHRGHEGVTRV